MLLVARCRNRSRRPLQNCERVSIIVHFTTITGRLAVVLAFPHFHQGLERLPQLTGSRKDYLTQGKSFEGLDLARDPSPGRDVAL